MWSAEMDKPVWKSRWLSWSFHPNEPYGFCGRKATLNHASALVTVCPQYVNWHLRTWSSTLSSSSTNLPYTWLCGWLDITFNWNFNCGIQLRQQRMRPRHGCTHTPVNVFVGSLSETITDDPRVCLSCCPDRPTCQQSSTLKSPPHNYWSNTDISILVTLDLNIALALMYKQNHD